MSCAGRRRTPSPASWSSCGGGVSSGRPSRVAWLGSFSLQVREQALDRLLVRLVDQRGLAEPALLLAGLVGQDVAEVAAPPLHLALGGHLETLGRAPARLDLRHRGPFLLADQHDRHATAFHARLLLDAGHVGHLLGDPVEHRLAELGVRDRAPAEEDRHLDAVALGQEAADVPHLEVDVVRARLRADLHLLQDGGGRLLARLLRLLLLRIAELSEVHDAADGRVRGGRDLDQVELLLLRQAERLLRRHDAELRAVGADDAHLARPDLRVDPCLVLDLGYGTPPGMRAWAAVAATNASTAVVCGAPPVRGATVPAAASRSPTTATTGTFSSSASRTL